MIRLDRGDEPAELGPVRIRELVRLGALGRPPIGDDIHGYAIVKEVLWLRQEGKCCYCEHRGYAAYQDVEHYRPKARADRRPGCTETHGYWWLAFDWLNLMFACPLCNRSGKNDRFPLADAVVLAVGQAAPGAERPLLIDPAGPLNPVAHLRFVHGPCGWVASPRDGSPLGDEAIRVLDLNHKEKVALRSRHVHERRRSEGEALLDACREEDPYRVERAFDRATRSFDPEMPYAAATYDALADQIPGAVLSKFGLSWPTPQLACLPRRPGSVPPAGAAMPEVSGPPPPAGS